MRVGLRHEAAVLPFELHVLEVAIGDVCAVCTELVKELESSSHPALDALTKHVRSSSNTFAAILLDATKSFADNISNLVWVTMNL